MHIVLIYSDFQEKEKVAKTITAKDHVQMTSTIEEVDKTLKELGHKTTRVLADNHMLNAIEKLEAPDLIFCLTPGVKSRGGQANLIGMLEMTGVPVVGSNLTTHVLALNKEVTKAMFREAGLPTAKSQIFITGEEKIREDFTYPLLVKPENEGSGIGIDERSYVTNPQELRESVRYKVKELDESSLAEEFLPGREFTMGVWGHDELEVLPPREFLYEEDGVTYRGRKTKDESSVKSICPADVDPELGAELERLAKAAFRALRCRTYARVDIRLNAAGEPNLIELNSLPGLQPGASSFPQVAAGGGYTYKEMLERLIELTKKRDDFQA